MNDDLIKRTLNNVAEIITLSDPDKLHECIHQEILKKSLNIKKKKENICKENNLSNLLDDGKRKKPSFDRHYPCLFIAVAALRNQGRRF